MKTKRNYSPVLQKLLELKSKGMPHRQAVAKAAAHGRKLAAAKAVKE